MAMFGLCAWCCYGVITEYSEKYFTAAREKEKAKEARETAAED